MTRLPRATSRAQRRLRRRRRPPGSRVRRRSRQSCRGSGGGSKCPSLGEPLLCPRQQRRVDPSLLVVREEDRIEPQPEEVAPKLDEAFLVLRPARCNLVGPQPNAPGASAARVGEREEDAVDLGEALLPERILDDQ